MGPFFSIVIPTRNRPALLARAVNSVLAQDFDDYEVIVVDDGSNEALDLDGLQLDHDPGNRLRIVSLSAQVRGRGPGYARNVGVWRSSGRFCAFLDDDDLWIKSDHLAMAHAALGAGPGGPELYFTNQEAVTPEGAVQMLWLYPLGEAIREEGRQAEHGSFTVGVEELLSNGGFSHLNTTIASRGLFERVGGIDEYLSYEEDLDFYLRCIDAARGIRYRPVVVARHFAPDRNRQENASTAVGYLNRMNTRLYLLGKNQIGARHPAIRAYCRKYTGYTTRHIAEHFATRADYRRAAEFAARALGAAFSARWAAYTAYLYARSWVPWGKGHA